MKRCVRMLAATTALALALVGTAGCASAKDAMRTTVQQGVETTSTGDHNVVPANQAQDAVDAANDAVQGLPQEGVPEQ